jgi:hypothetical protein
MRYNFQTTKTIKDAIVQNPTVNVPKLLVAGMVVGEILGDAKETVRTTGELIGNHAWGEGDKGLDQYGKNIATRRENFANFQLDGLSDLAGFDLTKVPGLPRALANLQTAFALGIPFDILASVMERGDVNLGDMTVAGSEVQGAIGGLKTAITEGDMQNIGREAVSRVPYIGRGMASEIDTIRQKRQKVKDKDKGLYF